MKKKLVISNIFFLSFSSAISPWLGVIKNSACDCPSQLLYFVYFFSLSSRSHLDSELFFFLFKSRSYQLFPHSSPERARLWKYDHDSTLFFEEHKAVPLWKRSLRYDTIRNHSRFSKLKLHLHLPRYRVKHQNIFCPQKRPWVLDTLPCWYGHNWKYLMCNTKRDSYLRKQGGLGCLRLQKFKQKCLQKMRKNDARLFVIHSRLWKK